GGSNAHLIVEEYDNSPKAPVDFIPGGYWVPVSAMTEERLQVYVGLLLSYLEELSSKNVSENPSDTNEVLDIIRQGLSGITNIPVSDIDVLSTFQDLGMDRVVLDSLISVLSEPYPIAELSTLVYSSNSIEALADALSVSTFSSLETLKQLQDFSWTLQVGRSAMDARVLFQASNLSDLQSKMKAYLSGVLAIDKVYSGNVSLVSDDAIVTTEISSALASEDYNAVGSLWTLGHHIPWESLYKEGLPEKISIPTYPFSRDRHWFDRKKETQVSYATNDNRLAPVAVPLTPVVQKPIEKAAVQKVSLAAPKRLTIANKGISTKLVRLLSEVTDIEISNISGSQKFIDMGLDSILGIEFSKSINGFYELNISATDLYDHPTIDSLSKFIGLQLQPTETSIQVNETITLVEEEKTLSTSRIVLDTLDTTTTEKTIISHIDINEIVSSVTVLLSDVTDIEIKDISEEQKFIDMGLDSILGIEFSKSINAHYELNISATDLYDHPTIKSLSSFIAPQISGTLSDITVQEVPEVATKAPSKVQLQSLSEPLLITGNNIQINNTSSPLVGLRVDGISDIACINLQPITTASIGAEEVLISVRASGVNFPDVMCIKGLYPTMPAYPFVPGFEVSGIVQAIGAQVSHLKVGDAVIGLTGSKLGGHGAEVIVPAKAVVQKPASISFSDACGLPVIFVTIYHALQQAGIQSGDKVLVQTAAGGCGLMAVQLCKLFGATVVGTSSKETKLSFLERIGVLETLNYSTGSDAFVSKAQSLYGGFDVVINMLSGDMIQAGLDLLSPGGCYVELAVHGLKSSGKLDLSKLTSNQSFKSIDVRRLSLGGDFNLSEALSQMVSMLSSGAIVPVTSKVFPFSKIGEALAYVNTGAHIGKVVLDHSLGQEAELVDKQAHLEQSLYHQQKQSQQNNNITLNSLEQTPQSLPIATVQEEKRITEQIAIIGMSGRFPGSDTLEAFWDNLSRGVDLVGEVPSERWSIADHYSDSLDSEGKSYSKWGGFLSDIDKFDPQFFHISPAEAEMMDPQQRLFLEESWRAIEDGGYSPEAVSGTSCGVFIGAASGDYGTAHRASKTSLDYYSLAGGAASILSARIAYT
ncbi:beta-ketoacyl synthase N-terminal-like domain-containing protein, partial [Aquimarina aggregata]|uniref:beta-ketoacyl synthase N-terminal-like domain-containing protein n=1 Tax=Aquimarina aggregata TaxID=1642818 RepID=UPI0024931BA5